MDDAKIIELFVKRDEEALRQTERKYSRFLMSVAMNILGSREDSSECVNDTYLKAWEHIPPDAPPRLSCYLGKITRRLSIGRKRKMTAKKRGESQYALSLEELEDCIPSGCSPEQETDAQLLAQSINAFLYTCGEQARNVFLWRYYFCDSIKDIAKNGNMSESKAKSLLSRTRKSLKQYLEKEGYNI